VAISRGAASSELIALAIDNVKTKERIELAPMEISSARLFAVTVPSVVRGDAGLVVEDLLGHHSVRALVAMPTGTSSLCHAIADARSLRSCRQWRRRSRLEGGPRRSPGPFWNGGIGSSPFRSCEDGEVKCELHRSSTRQVAQLLS